jgi:hypothetical protein
MVTTGKVYDRDYTGTQHVGTRAVLKGGIMGSRRGLSGKGQSGQMPPPLTTVSLCLLLQEGPHDLLAEGAKKE